jgi:lipopolysaccharide export LptBFGC system permease protein LptF
MVPSRRVDELRGAIMLATILWLIAVVLVIWGIMKLLKGQVLNGIVTIIIGLLIGPGGVSIFHP